MRVSNGFTGEAYRQLLSLAGDDHSMVVQALHPKHDSDSVSFQTAADRIVTMRLAQHTAHGGEGPENDRRTSLTEPPAMESRSALDVLQTAAAAQRASEQAGEMLHTLLTQAMRHAIQPGDTLDKRDRTRPEFLHSFMTRRGNDRSTRAFQVVDAPSVQLNLAQPERSTWSCEALAISEKTGKPMSAQTGGRYNMDARTTVLIQGDVLSSYRMSEDVTPMQRLATFIETYRFGRPTVAPAPSSSNSPSPSSSSPVSVLDERTVLEHEAQTPATPLGHASATPSRTSPR